VALRMEHLTLKRLRERASRGGASSTGDPGRYVKRRLWVWESP